MYFLESQNTGHCIPVGIMQIIISYKQLSHICVILLKKKKDTLTVSLSKSKVHPWPRALQEISPQLWILARNDKLTLNILLLFAGLDEWDTGLRPRNVPSGPDSLRVRYPGGILSPTGLPTHQHRPQGHVRWKSPRCLFCEVTLLSARKEQSKMRVRPE